MKLAKARLRRDSSPRSSTKREPESFAAVARRFQLLLDEGQSAGYPSVTMVDEQTVGILYEGSRAQMTFQRVSVAELQRRQP